MTRYKLIFYSPAQNSEACKKALFALGAGRIGLYEGCAFSTRGVGQFRPLEGATPAIGEQGKDVRVEEDRVEMIVNEGGADKVRELIKKLKEVHPYEEPAYEVFRLEDF